MNETRLTDEMDGCPPCQAWAWKNQVDALTARLAAVEALLDQRRDDLIYPTTSSTTERTMLISVAAVRAALSGDPGPEGSAT